jgi:UDPglucose--hexose-1-phosphate uridylyltransferase
VIGAERSAEVRVVDEVDGFIAFEPWAAQSPFETWIAPTFHQASFGELADHHVDDLARILIRTLGALRTASGDPDYNLVMYSARSNDGQTTAVFHWHLKLIPRIATQAGFEIGSAMSINTMAPEDAAGSLRRALANV